MYYPRLNQRVRSGQSIIESVAIFVVLVLLFCGIFQIWIRVNSWIVIRQQEYNQGRVAAGTSRQDYQLVWPLSKPEPIEEDKLSNGIS